MVSATAMIKVSTTETLRYSHIIVNLSLHPLVDARSCLSVVSLAFMYYLTAWNSSRALILL